MRRVLGLLATVALVALVASGCGAASRESVEIVIPAGTQDRLDAGEEVVVMPERLELTVGDVLVIRNQDDVTQSVGPHTVPADSVMRFTYGTAGTYEGYCPLSKDERYEIVVRE